MGKLKRVKAYTIRMVRVWSQLETSGELIT